MLKKIEKAPDVVKITTSTDIAEVHDRLCLMWTTYVNERVWDNPVALFNFFGEYQAWVGFYSTLANQMERSVAERIAEITKEIYADNAEEGVTFITALIRSSEKSISIDSDYYTRELKEFNRNVNAIQTLLRGYNTESKM